MKELIDRLRGRRLTMQQNRMLTERLLKTMCVQSCGFRDDADEMLAKTDKGLGEAVKRLGALNSRTRLDA